MHRTDAPGNDNNLYTEGNPSQGIPATEVSDDWLNDVQEELCNFIESMNIALVKGDQEQLGDAIRQLVGEGGDQLKQAIVNNQAGALDITDLVFDKADYKGAQIKFDIHRETDSSNEQESGIIFITHDPKDDAWHIDLLSHFDDAGVVFSITAAGQIQYVSDDLSGANYDGDLRITGITKFNQ